MVHEHPRLQATQLGDLPELPPGTPGVILERALELFAQRGYAGTSVRDIASGTGIRAASIYAHFASKEHVLAAICRLGIEAHLRATRGAIAQSPPDPTSQLDAWVRAHVGLHARQPMLSVVANAELHMLSQELGAEVFALRKQSEGVLVGILERGVATGAFDLPDVWLAAAAIAGSGLRVAFWYQPSYPRPIEEIQAIYAQMALRIAGVRYPHH